MPDNKSLALGTMVISSFVAWGGTGGGLGPPKMWSTIGSKYSKVEQYQC